MWAQGTISGNCGQDGHESDVTWELTNGTLIISGSGEMQNYYGEIKPGWKDALISRIIIRDGVTRVGDCAFYQCNLDNSVTAVIGNDVTHIGASAFYGCTTLSTVILGDGVTDIQGAAFAGCSSLTWFSIPASVTFIGTDAFRGCTSMTDVYCYTCPDPDPLKFYWYETGGDDFIVSPQKATKFHVLDEAAWSSFADLNVTFVGDLTSAPAVIASGDCSRPDGVSEVTWTLNTDGVLTISGTGKMQNYPSNEPGWGFAKSFITGIVIEDGVTIIGDGAFQGCISMSKVTFGANVTDINGFAFQNCSSLTTLTIPANVTFIGSDAFKGCTSLTDVYCYTYPDPDPLKFYWLEAGCDDFIVSPPKATLFHVFDAEAWSSIVSDANVTFVGDLPPVGPTIIASGNCGSSGHESDVTWELTDDGVFTISGSGSMMNYTTLGDRPWNNNVNDIKSVVIDEGVLSIGIRAFFACSSLTSVTIPASVTSIATRAFYNCSTLTTVTLNSCPLIAVDAFPGGASVTMNMTANSADGAYWSTFYNKNCSFLADENTQVFKAELKGTGLTLHEVANRIVDANTPVILKSTGNPVMTMTSSASGDSQANSLVGVDNTNGKNSDGTMYVLNYTEANGVGFYKLASGKRLGIGKAYLTYSDADSRSFFLIDEATGIEQMEAEAGEGDGKVYDLQGREVENPAPGIYIVNGKKVFIK